MKLRHGEVSGVCCLPGSADGHQHISAEGARDTAIPWLPFSALLLVIPNAGDEHTTVLHALVRRDRAPAQGSPMQ